MNTDIQHTQMVLGMAIAIAMLGTMLFSLAGRWIGGVWTTLLATFAVVLLAYQPLIGASLFASFKTDLLRRILIGTIPFAVVTIALSFTRVPGWIRLVLVLIGPQILLYWIFSHFDLAVPRQTMYLQKILPLCGILFVSWLLIEPLNGRSPGAAAPIVVGASTAGLAFLLLLSSETLAGTMAPLIPATAGGAVLAAIIASLIRKPIVFSRGPVLLWLTLMTELFAFMWLDTDKLPLPYLYWIAAAPLLGWIPDIGPIHRLKPWKRESIRLVLVIIPVTVAVILAVNQHRKEAAESGDEYGLIYPPAPSVPSQMPIPNTINPPTIT